MDLFVISGMGSYHDAGGKDAIDMLETIQLMALFGIPSFAFGQGIGPIDRFSNVWPVAQKCLPRLELIALREARSGPTLLSELGVPPNKILITGDDAIEYAYRTPLGFASHLLGFNLRVAYYSGLGPEDARRVARVVHATARGLRATIVPTAISYVPGESDMESFRNLFPEHAPAADDDPQATPARAVEDIGRCRLVVTGAYHSALFALSQGIPALCLYNSPYYRDKFLGLAVQFGSPGCAIIDLSQPDYEERIRTTLEELWSRAIQYEKPLLSAAEGQIRRSKAAWARLRSLKNATR
jgi:colanic acid/amylovoran biosynthesis protein